MKKFLEVSIIFGIIFGVQPVVAIPSKVEVSKTTEKSQTVGQLETPPPQEVETKPNVAVPEAQDTKIKKFVFDFDNSYDYTACLDVILLTYEGRNAELKNVSKNKCATNVLNVFGNNLSKKDVALQLVKSAHLHATKGLEDPLYPSLGLRRRIAINLGYVYDIDKNNSDILKYVNSELN